MEEEPPRATQPKRERSDSLASVASAWVYATVQQAPSPQLRRYAGLNLLALVQLVTILCLVGIHGYSSLGIVEETRVHNISSMASLSGYLMVTVTEAVNPYIGPTDAVLVKSYAAFAPCMRKDDVIFTRYETIEEVSANGSCCGRCVALNNRTGVSHCLQTDRQRCNTLYSQPASTFVTSTLCSTARVHNGKMLVSTLSACCIGLLGHCHMTTIEECMHTFNGKWFVHKMCRQVNCLGEVCGGTLNVPANSLSPYRPLRPDQLYRWILACFLHRGLVEFLVLLNIQYWLGRPIEVENGSVRTVAVFFMSGFGGHMVATALQPYKLHLNSRCSTWGYSAYFPLTVLRDFSPSSAPLVKLANHLCFFAVMLGLDALFSSSPLANIAGFFFGMWTLLVLQKTPWFEEPKDKPLWKQKDFWLRMHGATCVISSIAIVAVCFFKQVKFPQILSDYTPDYCGRGVRTLNNPAALVLYDQHEFDYFVYHTNRTSELRDYSCM